MSELRDQVVFAETVDRSFDEQAKWNAEQAKINADVAAKLEAHDKAFAAIDRSEKNLENLFTVLQDQVREEFRRLRLGIGLGTNGSK